MALITRVASASLLAGSALATVLLVLALAGQPVGLGGMHVLGPLVVLAIALVGVGAAGLALRPTVRLARAPVRIALSVVAAGALGLVLVAIRAAQPIIHPDADMAGVGLFVALGFGALGLWWLMAPGVPQ